MKTRILPIIGMAFSVLLLARAISVSSEVLPSKKESHAKEAAAAAVTAEPGHDKTAGAMPGGKPAVDAEGLCLTGEVLEILKTDKADLSTRLAALAVREKALASLEAKLKEQMEIIETANDKMEKQIGLMKSVANEDISHLVKMYQTMKPKQAAAIFESMDPAFAAGFLREMSGEKAGLIMANMDSRKSYSISVMMASKNSKYR